MADQVDLSSYANCIWTLMCLESHSKLSLAIDPSTSLDYGFMSHNVLVFALFQFEFDSVSNHKTHSFTPWTVDFIFNASLNSLFVLRLDTESLIYTPLDECYLRLCFDLYLLQWVSAFSFCTGEFFTKRVFLFQWNFRLNCSNLQLQSLALLSCFTNK